MNSIRVDDTRLKKAFRLAPDRIKHELNQWVGRTIKRAERHAKQQAPVKTGLLQNTILSNQNGLSGIVKPTRNYAKYVIGGTGLYGPFHKKIVPVTAHVLASKANPGFGARTKYGFIIGKSSRGQRSNPFMNRAYDLTKPEAERDISETLDKVIAEI